MDPAGGRGAAVSDLLYSVWWRFGYGSAALRASAPRRALREILRGRVSGMNRTPGPVRESVQTVRRYSRRSCLADLHSSYMSTRMMSERVTMNVLSVLKSRIRTAGFWGVIIVDRSSTGVEMSTNGKACCMMASTG
jgi:hypothetical protein